MYIMLCTVWYHLHNLKNVEKSIALPWMFFAFFKLYRWYQIAQSITYIEYCIRDYTP